MVDLLRVAPLFCLLLRSVLGATLQDNSPGCDCYVTDGSSSAYYTYHRFFDFRELQAPGGLYDREPANVTDRQGLGQEVGQQGYLNSTAFLEDWMINTWGKEPTSAFPVQSQNSKQNVWIQTNEDNPSVTHLTLRTYRNSKFSSNAEVESLQKNLFRSSIRLRARIRGASGAVAGMFTYFNDTTESDIEILTRDPTTHIRYTNQPNVDSEGSVIAASETNATLPDSVVWTEWNTHRMDWTPKVSAWYVNDIFVSNKTYGVPQFPSYLTLNMWSDGGEWSGNMTVGSAAYLEIQWIDMVFNTSGPVNGNAQTRLKARSAGCRTVCAVDGVQQPGFPEIIHKASSAASDSVGNCPSLLIWGIPLLVAILGLQADLSRSISI